MDMRDVRAPKTPRGSSKKTKFKAPIPTTPSALLRRAKKCEGVKKKIKPFKLEQSKSVATFRTPKSNIIWKC